MKTNCFLNNTVKTLFILLAFASFECNDNPVSTVEISLGTDFDLKYGQTANFRGDNLSITFKDVADERCPIGLECFWEGSAYITLTIQQNGTNMTDTVQTFIPEKTIKTDSASNYYLFVVKGLAPYPIYEKEVRKEKYILTLNVSRLLLN